MANSNTTQDNFSYLIRDRKTEGNYHVVVGRALPKPSSDNDNWNIVPEELGLEEIYFFTATNITGGSASFFIYEGQGCHYEDGHTFKLLPVDTSTGSVNYYTYSYSDTVQYMFDFIAIGK